MIKLAREGRITRDLGEFNYIVAEIGSGNQQHKLQNDGGVFEGGKRGAIEVQRGDAMQRCRRGGSIHRHGGGHGGDVRLRQRVR